MKINGVPGEFAFKALVPVTSTSPSGYVEILGYTLSNNYFLNRKEVANCYGKDETDTLLLWPVEVCEDGRIYIPHKSELEEEDAPRS